MMWKLPRITLSEYEFEFLRQGDYRRYKTNPDRWTEERKGVVSKDGNLYIEDGQKYIILKDIDGNDNDLLLPVIDADSGYGDDDVGQSGYTIVLLDAIDVEVERKGDAE